MVSNRACALVILILFALFELSQVLRAEVPAMQGVVGTPLLLLGPGWAIMRFFVSGLHLFEAVVAVTLSLTVWTLTALLLLDLHTWQPLAAADAELGVVALVALFSLWPSRTERPA
jgi:accessory gene regulator protein AgrB